MSSCQNAALKECFYPTAVEDLFYEYNGNFSLQLMVLYIKNCWYL